MKTETISNRCPKCAALLPEMAPQGLCPKCLLAGVAAPTEAGQSPEQHPLPSLEAVASAFPNLAILEPVGRGGMGVVFKARQLRLDRWVALKVLPQSLAADPAFTDRFNREARVLARLNHPNIVTVYDFGQAGDFFFLLMEFVDGVNLRQAMQGAKFSPAQALSLVPQICEALQFAHDEGILHRDIKPENILLDAKGRVKIADFGIAKLVGEPFPMTKLTATGAAIGTPNYMAPEQLEHPEDVDQRADIYSLGVVFYEMLTGELPIGRFAPPSAKTPVDSRVDEVVFRSLEHEREKRFRNANEVKTRVESIRGTPPPAPTDQPTPAPRLSPNAPDWQQLWFGWAAQTRLAIKAALLGAAVLLSLAFVSYRLDYVTVGQHLVRTSNVGLGKPWLSWWGWSPEHNLSFNYGLDLFTYSFAAGVGAVTCWILFARIRSAERQQAVPRAAMTATPEQEAVRQQVAPVATALFILGLVNCLLILGLGVLYYSTLAGQSPDSPESLSNRAMALLVSLALGLVSGALMIAGARTLRQIASRESAILACICAMIPPLSPTFLIGIPIAVWGLKVLRQPEVKAAFASQARRPPFMEPPL